MEKLLLFPFNGNAREAVTVIEAINEVEPQWDILGFIDDDLDKMGQTSGGVTVLGGRDLFSRYDDTLVLAVPGRPENFMQRRDIIQSLGLSPQRFATILHPAASQGYDSILGYNTLVMHNVVLTANVRVGNHVVLLPNTVIAHDVNVADYTMVGSNVTISGSVILEENCYIGSGARLIQEVRIGYQALVGMGSVVLHDVGSSTVVAGNPARKIRELP